MGMICTCSMHCPLSGYHDKECCEKNTCACWCHIPRASAMPAPIDPLFLSALREIPEDAKDEDLPMRARKAGAV